MALAALLVAAASCRKVEDVLGKGTEPVWHTPARNIWPDSLCLALPGGEVSMVVRGDTALISTGQGKTPATVVAPEPLGGRFALHTATPVLDFLYALEAAAPLPGRYSASMAYDAYMSPLGVADSLALLLESRLRGRVVAPGEYRHYPWPTVDDTAPWLLAAAAVASASPTAAALRTRYAAVAREAAATFRQVTFDASGPGLFMGLPPYLAPPGGPQSLWPRWMEAPELSRTVTLATNVAWLTALRGLGSVPGLNADTLRRNINVFFWIPNLGCYSAALYGPSWCQRLQLPSADNVAQALAVISGCASEPMANALVGRTPVPSAGITPLYPLWNQAEASRKVQAPRPAKAPGTEPLSPAMTAALWASAAARTGCHRAYEDAVGQLLARVAERVAQGSVQSGDRPLTAWLLRGLLGMDFADDGVHFVPNVPATLPGDKAFRGVAYRRATLDINLRGTGQAISTFMVDSVAAVPFISAELTGHHTVDITLAGPSEPRGGFTPVKEAVTLPPTVTAGWTSPRQALLSSQGPELVYLNGVFIEEIIRDKYTLYNASVPTSVQFAPLSDTDGYSGFGSRPHIYYPPGSVTVVYATDVARGGTRIIADRKVAARYVETNKWKNRTLSFPFAAPGKGRYAVELHYLSGMGMVNPWRRTALRALRLDGATERLGVFVLMQTKSPATPEADNGSEIQSPPPASWQQQTAFSNPLVIDMEAGQHTLDVSFYQPSPVYIDPLANTVLIDLVRVTRLTP